MGRHHLRDLLDPIVCDRTGQARSTPLLLNGRGEVLGLLGEVGRDCVLGGAGFHTGRRVPYRERSTSMGRRVPGSDRTREALSELVEGSVPTRRVSVPSSSGLRPDITAPTATASMGFSSFFIRTSAGRRMCGNDVEVVGFSSFFIRTSAGLLDRGRNLCTVSFQFLLHQDFGRTVLEGIDLSNTQFQFLLHQDFGRTRLSRQDVRSLRFQFLLHQDFGRTHVRIVPHGREGFSSFFIRTSAGLYAAVVWVGEVCFSSFFIRTSAGRTSPPLRGRHRVSVPSSSGLRPDC